MAPRRDPLAWAKVSDVTEAEGFAIKAMQAGTATPDQQRLALATILRMCMTDEQTFVLEQDGGERATAFASGRRAVGLALRTLIALPVDNLRSKHE